ncbi:3-oxoacyl-ACP synthase [Nocardia sp. MDA0666]|uniref:beta-ketoacyl-[acyl-carrier-protein] synthase family protein n=1 Tax=Nocardia sp. MDA0666 TaxID=2135448 RepID=UPI000D136DB6|nr:beta-ketoacyl synthase N-terminal-like domain-containing protein [Nocardia sp. MDA0666]PSR68659.1 3-oxoacyl-ACP synthase [Nocardia sp. MDA0666]
MNARIDTSWPITGTGAVAAIGDTVPELFAALCAGRTGVAEIRRFPTRDYRTHHGYPRHERGSDTAAYATRLLIRAVAEAMTQSGLDDLTDIPVIVGTGLRELRSVELAWQAGPDSGVPRLDFGPALRERFGCTEVHTLSNACAASLHALGLAEDLLAADRADAVVVAGTDTIAVSMFAALDLVQPAMTTLRPFDARHKGVLMGDGAAAAVLQRGGTARAVLRGVGISCDAGHVTAPDPVGIVAAMHDAHRRAGVRPADVDLVLAHGTGTALNDAAEATALTTIFGTEQPIVTAVKAMTGHTSGSSGLVSLVAAIESLRTGAVPAIPDLAVPIDEARSLRLAASPIDAAELRVAQVNSFGFGGVNAVAIVERVA